MLVDQRRSRPARHRVTVLGSFTTSPDVAEGDAGRVVAYLAVHRRPQRRAHLAADLWPGEPAAVARQLLDDALGSLRDTGLLDAGEGGTDGPVALDPAVEVDLDAAMALVRTLADASGRPAGLPDDVPATAALLRADVLPGWRAAWLAVERERFRQLRLTALEDLSSALSAAGRHAEAVALAEEVVRTAPSRESARRALIEAHLGQGGIAEAVAQYDEYQELLRSSVGASHAPGLEGVLPPVPAWPVLRVRQPGQRVGVALPGVGGGRRGQRRLVSGGSVPGTTR